jgi:hypothetical protein
MAMISLYVQIFGAQNMTNLNYNENKNWLFDKICHIPRLRRIVGIIVVNLTFCSMKIHLRVIIQVFDHQVKDEIFLPHYCVVSWLENIEMGILRDLWWLNIFFKI